MRTTRVRASGRIMLGIAALPCWVVLVLGAAPLLSGQPVEFGGETPVFLLIAVTLTTIVVTGRLPVLE